MSTDQERRPELNWVPLPIAMPTLRSEVMLRMSKDRSRVRRGGKACHSRCHSTKPQLSTLGIPVRRFPRDKEQPQSENC